MTPKPDYERDGIRLYCGDCLEILPQLEAGSVACVVTDPPYALPAAHCVGARSASTPQRSIGDLSIVEYWFKGVAALFPDGVPLYVFCDGQSYPIFFRSCYSRWKRIRPLIWDKVASFNGYTWRHQHELIAWCESDTCERVPTGDGDIIRCRVVPVDKRSHPAEKPVELIEAIIGKTEGTILDPFMGSGTTGIACVKHGRQFIGIEIEPKYFDIAVKRIEEAFDSQALFRQEATP